MTTNTTTQELFIVMPSDIDDLVRATEQELLANDFERGLLLYHYLYDRRAGKTHSEAMTSLRQIDKAEVAAKMRA